MLPFEDLEVVFDRQTARNQAQVPDQFLHRGSGLQLSGLPVQQNFNQSHRFPSLVPGLDRPLRVKISHRKAFLEEGCLKQTNKDKRKRVIHEGPRRTTKGHQGVEVDRDGMPRSRRDGRFLIVSLSNDPPGTAGSGLADKREFPKRRWSAFREVARRIPSVAPSGRPTRERGRLARMLSLGLPLSFPAMRQPAPPAGGNRMGPVEAEPGRRYRSIRVEEMGEALPVLCGRDARAPGWAFSHDARISRSRYRRCIRARLVIEAGPSLFVYLDNPRRQLWELAILD